MDKRLPGTRRAESLATLLDLVERPPYWSGHVWLRSRWTGPRAYGKSPTQICGRAPACAGTNPALSVGLRRRPARAARLDEGFQSRI